MPLVRCAVTTPAEGLLDTMLPFAVAMKLQRMTAQERAATIARWTEAAKPVLLDHGDALLHYRPPYTAEVFNRLGEALAALAQQPGGVNFGNRHWEA